MKKILLSLIVLTLSIVNSKGQNIPNGNFESWATLNGTLQPTGWKTSNTSGWISITKATPGYNSTASAAKISEASIYGYSIGASALTQKFAYSQRPVSLTGAYKILPQTGDSVYIIISASLTKNKAIIGDLVQFYGSTTATGFIEFKTNFYYGPSDLPDTATVTVTVFSKKQILNSGAEIDELSFSNVSGVNELHNNISVGNIFPLPAKDYVSVPVNNVKQGNMNVNLYDLSGNLVKAYQEKISGSKILELEVSDIVSGLYLMSFETNEGMKIVRKLVVSH